ncbi:Carbonic anhydrase 6 [Fukomys damarensis]|uniref:Carbonic anhydrase 6 n=1 Tax=Fukomys damarensis TaxID=885580 RepID=A0A091DAB0_FUKDA|nr:Carbonic anhydrase 6 [Fukomys damarensis]
MGTLATLVSLLLLWAQAPCWSHSSEWTYSGGELDEEHWPRGYPECGGNRQSPIDLQRRKVRFNSALRALDLEGYGDDEAGQFPVTNNGHTVQISLPSSMRMTGPDGTVYRAVQMHYHWGGESFEVSGSEHTIDGMRRAMEIHVVHYNAKYESYEVAKDAPGGLAVLAAFVEAENAENTYYSSFISNLASIKHAGQSTVLHGLSVLNMLPQDLFHYYSYEGSLTTPPCTQNVRWFVLADSVKISNVQVWKMENTLLTHQNRTLQNGYRSTQPLHSRVVEANFRYFPSSVILSFIPYVLGSELRSYLHRIENNIQYLVESLEEVKRQV